jgi:hypothetical protein
LDGDGKGNFKRHLIQKNGPERHVIGDMDRDSHLP